MKMLTQKRNLPQVIQLAVFCSAFWAVPVLAGEGSFTPTLSVSEEYNDNIRNTAQAKESDFITRIQPGLATTYRAPALNGDLRYNFDYQDYARGTRSNEKNHYLDLRGSAELVDNFFFLEVSDKLSRVSLDVARDVTTESLHANQSDQNRALISPYLLWRLGERTALKTGYRFIDTTYSGSEGIDRQEHVGFAELSSNRTSKLSLNAGYSFSSIATDVVDYDQHDLRTGFRYEYADKSFLFGGIGNSWQEFADARRTSNLFWNAGISKDFGYLIAALETRVQYVDDPVAVSREETIYSLSLDKALLHGAVGVSTSYTEYLETLTGSERRKGAVNGFWRNELSPGLNATVTLTGDRVTRETAATYPYHFSGSAGLSYLFNYDITGSLNYSYIEYRQALDSATEAKQTNRFILELRKVF